MVCRVLGPPVRGSLQMALELDRYIKLDDDAPGHGVGFQWDSLHRAVAWSSSWLISHFGQRLALMLNPVLLIAVVADVSRSYLDLLLGLVAEGFRYGAGSQQIASQQCRRKPGTKQRICSGAVPCVASTIPRCGTLCTCLLSRPVCLSFCTVSA
jgi:hypothetical protein